MAFKTVASASKTVLDITDAYTVILTNESCTVACDKDGTANAGELGASGKAKSSVVVYRGSTLLTGVASAPVLGQFSYAITTPTNCTANRTDNTSFYINTISADSGSVTLTITVEGDVTVTKVFNFSKVKIGASGVSVVSVVENYLATALATGVTTATLGWTTAIQSLTLTNKYLWNYEIINYSSGSPTTTAPVIIGVYGDTGDTGRALSNVVEWYLATSAATGVTRATGGWTTTMQTTTATNKYLWNYEVLTWSVAPITTYVEPVIIGVYGDKGTDGTNGNDAIIGILTNESCTVPTLFNGTGGVFTNAVTTMAVYKGVVDDSANWSVTAGTPVGLTGSIAGKTYTVTAMSTDSAYVDLTAARSGYSSIVKRFTLSKSKQGIVGDTPTAYWMVNNSSAISKSISGTYTPTTITATGKSQTGISVPTDYAGRFIIAETTDGTVWTDKYTSSANEVSKTYTPSANIKSIRIRMYLAGGVATLLDEQITPIVVDGATGLDGYTVVLGNDSHTFPGDETKATPSSSTTSSIIVYKGATQIASSVTVTGNPTGMDVSVAGQASTTNSFTATINATTPMTTKNGVLTVTITADGKTFVKKFSFAVANKGTSGSNGTDAKLVKIVANNSYFTTNTISSDPAAFIYTPATIDITPTFQPVATCLYSKWQYSINGTQWNDIVAQNGLTVNATTKVLTVASTSTLFSPTQPFLVFKVLSTTGEADVVTLNRIFESGAIGGRIGSAETTISQHAASILLKASSQQLVDSINAIKIGGRNLIVRSGEFVDQLIGQGGTIGAGAGYAVMEDYIEVVPGEILTFTKTVSTGTVDGGYWRWSYHDTNKTYMLRVTNDTNSFQWTVPEGALYIRVSYPMDAFPKLEKGNKATDWSPSSEDVSKEIAAAALLVTQNNQSSLKVTDDAIRGDVSRTYTSKEDLVAYDKTIGTTFTQTYEAFNLGFTESYKVIDANKTKAEETFTEINKYIKFENGNILLGESGNIITLKIQNNKISFFSGTNEVAWFAENKLHVKESEFSGSMRIGNFAFKPDITTGNLSFGKVT